MKFDHTKGQTTKYIVNLYSGMIEDHFYFHYFKEAKACYENLTAKGQQEGTVVSLYDTAKDVRKLFTKF